METRDEFALTFVVNFPVALNQRDR